MSENWKEIEGFKNYEVNEEGLVRNKKTGNLLKQTKNASGYYVVTMYKEKKSHVCSVHRLVAEAFIPNPNNCKFVRHKLKKSWNGIDGLEWVSVLQTAKVETIDDTEPYFKIPNFENYELTKSGKIRNATTKGELQVNENGTVRIFKGRQIIKPLAFLMASTFVENPENLKYATKIIESEPLSDKNVRFTNNKREQETIGRHKDEFCILIRGPYGYSAKIFKTKVEALDYFRNDTKQFMKNVS